MRGERGQTSFDFLVGATVFLLSAGFVLATISGMVDPFVGGQEHTLVADRVTTILAGGFFAESGTPSGLDETCTYGFFNHTYDPANGTDCSVGYLANESDLSERLDVADRYAINVSLRRVDSDGDATILCTDGEDLVTCPGETRLADGRTPPDSRSAVTAQRVVYLDGQDVLLEVRVW